MRRASERFAKDYRSSGPVAKARVEALRTEIGQDNFKVLVAAAVHSVGPRKFKDIGAGSFEHCRDMIHMVLNQAARFYGLQIGRR